MDNNKDAYWNHVKKKRHSNTNSRWLNGEIIVIPQYLQRKQFNNKHPYQRKIREAAVLNDFKTEIDLRSLRSSQQEENVKRLYSKMETLFKERNSLSAAKILLDMWKEQASQKEKISHRRWLKIEKWLRDYEENFIQPHMSWNPFFKVERREQAYYAELTAQPRKKSPVYAEVTRRPKTKTHFNRQSTATSEQQQKHQPNLEAI